MILSLLTVSSVVNFVYVLFVVLFFFGMSIFLHELGHYWVAKKRGLKVEKFSIGFGPKIFSWTTKEGIEWRLSWFPFGGYVALPQMVTSEMLEGKGDAEAPLPPITPWSKILVSLAGPVMNVLFALALAVGIYYVGVPVPVNPPIVGFVEPDSVEWNLGVRPNDLIVKVNGKPMSDWEKVNNEVILSRSSTAEVDFQRENKTFELELPLVIREGIPGKWLNLFSASKTLVGEVMPSSPAEAVGLKPGDEILAMDGRPIVSPSHFTTLVKELGEKSTLLTVIRDGVKRDIQITPKMDPKSNRALIGIVFDFDHMEIRYRIEHPGPWNQIKDVTTMMYRTLAALVFSKETNVGLKDLSGPAGIIPALWSQIVQDFRLGMKFAVLLNINLAILNLLPIPVLDGGHIVMAILEAIRRKPLSPQIVEKMTTAFAILLLTFMAYVTFFDIKRLPMWMNLIRKGPAPIEQTNEVQPSVTEKNVVAPQPAK